MTLSSEIIYVSKSKAAQSTVLAAQTRSYEALTFSLLSIFYVDGVLALRSSPELVFTELWVWDVDARL